MSSSWMPPTGLPHGFRSPSRLSAYGEGETGGRGHAKQAGGAGAAGSAARRRVRKKPPTRGPPALDYRSGKSPYGDTSVRDQLLPPLSRGSSRGTSRSTPRRRKQLGQPAMARQSPDVITLPTVQPAAEETPEVRVGGQVPPALASELRAGSGEPFAIVLGYVVKARTVFGESLRTVNDLAERTIASVRPPTEDGEDASRDVYDDEDGVRWKRRSRPSSSTSRPGSAARDNVLGSTREPAGKRAEKRDEKYYSLVEYVQLRDEYQRKRAEDERADRAERDRAAERIQAIYRGHAEREKRKAKSKAEERAAILLQSACRGFLIRKDRMVSVRLAQLEKTAKERIIARFLHKVFIKLAMRRDRKDRAEAARKALAQRRAELVLQAKQREALEEHAKLSGPVAVQLSQWRAALVIQRAVRGWVAKIRVQKRRKAIVCIQTAIRRVLAKDSMYWRYSVKKLVHERRVKRDYAVRRRCNLMTHKLEEEMLLRHSMLEKERQHGEKEIGEENARFEKAWQQWCKQMRTHCLRQPLRKEWVPQVDGVSSETYYVNVVTGARQIEHPHMTYVEVNQQKGRAKAQQRFEEVSAPLHDYLKSLHDAVSYNRILYQTRIRRRRCAALVAQREEDYERHRAAGRGNRPKPAGDVPAESEDETSEPTVPSFYSDEEWDEEPAYRSQIINEEEEEAEAEREAASFIENLNSRSALGRQESSQALRNFRTSEEKSRLDDIKYNRDSPSPHRYRSPGK